jgi:serine O-acetyltransferase
MLTSTKSKTLATPAALWQILRKEAETIAAAEPVLTSYIHSTVLYHTTLEQMVSFILANFLDSQATPALLLREIFLDVMNCEPQIVDQICRDIAAWYERDPACDHHLMPALYFKGFHALQTWRVSHWLWLHGRQTLAMHLQNRASEVFAVDIHPAATIGSGIMLDHATGIVIGATAIIEDDVSLLHGVTLGGSGLHTADRHPKVRRGAMLAAGAKVLGPIDIGKSAKIGAGSVALINVPANNTAAGVPARLMPAKNSSDN